MRRRRELRDSPEEATIRAAIRRAVGERGLRAVNRELVQAAGKKISPTVLQNFVGGTYPQPPTWRALRAWFLATSLTGHAGPESGEPSPDGIRVALETILLRLPEEWRREAREQVVGVLAQFSVTRGLPVPGWLDSLEGGAEAYAHATPVRALSVELVGGKCVQVSAPQDLRHARAEMEGIARAAGVWVGGTYHPPHAVVGVRLMT